MAQRPTRVPKFGSWDVDNDVPYTTVFENARAGKGGNIFNPNDPSENPDSFPFDVRGTNQLSQVDKANQDETLPRSHPARHQRRMSKEEVEFWQAGHERRMSREEMNFGKASGLPAGGDFPTRRDSSPQRLPVRPNDVGARRSQPTGLNRENGVSEHFGGESPYQRPSSTNSPLHAQASQGRLGRKHGSASPAWDRRTSEGGDSFTPGTPGRVKQSEKGAPLPKFGEWDVNNPASGEGFTVIFNKAREEKKTGGAFPIPPMQTDSPQQNQVIMNQQKQAASGNESSALRRMCCGCLVPSTK